MKKLTSLVLALGLCFYSLGCAKPTEESAPASTPTEEAPADDAGSTESGSDTSN